MANSDPSKTEKPTAKRLNEERNKGNIPNSQDVTSVVTLLGVTIAFGFLAPKFGQAFGEVFRFSFALEITDWTIGDIREGIFAGMEIFASSFFVVLAITFFLTVLSIRAQVGSFFNTKPLEWKFDFLNPATGAKQLLPDKKKIVQLGLTIGKVIVISLVCYFMVRAEMDQLMATSQMPVITGSLVMLQVAFKMALYTLLLYILLAIIDIIWKRKKHVDDLMMTKEEVKEVPTPPKNS